MKLEKRMENLVFALEDRLIQNAKHLRQYKGRVSDTFEIEVPLGSARFDAARFRDRNDFLVEAMNVALEEYRFPNTPVPRRPGSQGEGEFETYAYAYVE